MAIPERSVLHRCDIRHASPTHLYLGHSARTTRIAPSAAAPRESTENRGEKSPLAKLTEAQVRAIMAELKSGSSRTHRRSRTPTGQARQTSSILHVAYGRTSGRRVR